MSTPHETIPVSSSLVRASGASDIGKVRKENQDSLLIHEPDDPDIIERRGVLVVLADGMGGLSDGKIASELTVETVKDEYYSYLGNPRASLEAAVKKANRVVFDKSNEGGENRQMGSTLTALVALSGRVLIAQIGDSRAYRYRRGSIEQLTRDHSLVRELVDRGEIDLHSNQYAFHRNILTRGLGLRPDLAVDIYELLGVEPGDTFLLSSDGLHELVEVDEMVSIIESRGEDLEAAALEFVELAKERGGTDNITVALVAVPDSTESAAVVPDPDLSRVRRSSWILPASILGSFVLGVILTLTTLAPPELTPEDRMSLRNEAIGLLRRMRPGLSAEDRARIEERVEEILDRLGQ